MADHEREMLHCMPEVLGHDAELKALNKRWVRTTLAGKINSCRVASTLVDFMERTQNNFIALQEKLITTLHAENCHKILLEMAGLSQVAIDILKRNLFERTADVGFLATDHDIRRFLLLERPTPADTEAMRSRLAAYRSNYTVYDEIVILDVKGRVRARLNTASGIASSTDVLFQQVLRQDGYVETYRPIDICPGRGPVLLYSHRIVDPERGHPLGVLCLCFDFQGEMRGVYQQLLKNREALLCILDEGGVTISSSRPDVIAVGGSLSCVLQAECKLVGQGGRSYLAKTSRTNGYQGFVGLPWLGHAMIPVEAAFRTDPAQDVRNGQGDVLRETRLFAGALREIDEEADEVLSDLELVVINGEVMAAKQGLSDDRQIREEAKALPPVLGAIQQVGENIRGVFSRSISSLMQTVVTSRLEDAKFQASLAIDIMDRNLYERANDCRWWALTSSFRHALAAEAMTEAQRAELNAVLAYINSLYTVYTTLFLFDKTGRVVASSTPEGLLRVGKPLDGQHVRQCLQLRDSRGYCVSDFVPCQEYPGPDGSPRHTYVYTAPVLHPDKEGETVGGVAIVFDSEPQFQAMLEDCLPRDCHGAILAGSSAVFMDRKRRILAACGGSWRVGDQLQLDEQYAALGNGEQRAAYISLQGRHFIMGCAMSAGYREYKRDGRYVNDVLAAVLMEM